MVFGRVSLTTTKKPFAVGEGERTIEYFKDDVIRIQPHVPHIYEFKEDTIFTENWEHEDGSPCEEFKKRGYMNRLEAGYRRRRW